MIINKIKIEKEINSKKMLKTKRGKIKKERNKKTKRKIKLKNQNRRKKRVPKKSKLWGLR